MKKIANRKKPKNKGFIDIYGIHTVKAALNNSKRKHLKLVISKSHRGLINHNIQQSVKKIIELSNKEMYELFGSESTHQGIVLTTSRLTQPNLDDILYESINKKTEVVIMLDQITDPNNIGSIIRSSSLFNCKSVIVSKDNSPDITPSMAKAASGALEIVNYIKVTNLFRAIEKFKKNNFWVYGLDNNVNNFNNNFEVPKKCLFVFGSEGKGLRQLTRKKCDRIISIPIKSNLEFKVESLNVSNACSIVLYEHYKKYN